MRKIEKRGIFCLILAALLGIGLALFCFRFVVDGGDWASYPYNRHLYNNEGVLKGGTILDRDGIAVQMPVIGIGGPVAPVYNKLEAENSQSEAEQRRQDQAEYTAFFNFPHLVHLPAQFAP